MIYIREFLSNRQRMKVISNIELAKKIDLIIVENLRKSEYDHDGSLDRFLTNIECDKRSNPRTPDKSKIQHIIDTNFQGSCVKEYFKELKDFLVV